MRTGATFRLIGKGGLTAAGVTAHVGIQPTDAIEAGSPRGRGSSAVHDSSVWVLRSQVSDHNIELSESISLVLSLLEPVEGQLWELDSLGYSADWFCYVESHAAEHAAELDRELLRRMLRLPGRALLLDVYGNAEASPLSSG